MMIDKAQTICPDCGVFNDIVYRTCWKCSRPISDEERLAATEAHEDARAELERQLARAPVEQRKTDEPLTLDDVRASGRWDDAPPELLAQAAKDIVLTTSFQLARGDIEREVGIVTAEVVYGMNVFRDLFAAVRDITGGRSEAVQKTLRDARKAVLLELKKEALMAGADAVIAVDLDYQEISGAGKGSMVMLVASGTAVALRHDDAVVTSAA